MSAHVFLNKFIRLFAHNPAKLPVILFLLVMLFLPLDGSTNANARLATMAALVSEQSFSIDNFPWTSDWAKSPITQKKYSNKPPGPALIGAPIYYAIDRLMLINPDKEFNHNKQRFHDRVVYGHTISLILQAIPYALLTLLIARWLQYKNSSAAAIHFGVLAILFGNTAALFMNSYFGHGLAAFCVLAAVYCLLTKHYALTGLLLGIAYLSDYGTIIITLPLVIGVVIHEQRNSFHALSYIIWGISAPLLISLVYHWAMFGQPFSLASQFSNPVYVDIEQKKYEIMGLFSSNINWSIFLALIFGSARGLFVTQPWILITAIAAIGLVISRKITRHDSIALIFFAISGLLLLLGANSTFNGWHGGSTPGPRYVSLILPVFGLLSAILYRYLPTVIRLALWLSLAVSLALFVIVYSTTLLAPANQPLWSFYWRFVQHSPSVKPLLSIVLTSTALAAVALAPLLTRNKLKLFGHKSQIHPQHLSVEADRRALLDSTCIYQTRTDPSDAKQSMRGLNIGYGERKTKN